MSIPKQPRQLMINIMYLVLTAILALNVSAEIFNAFRVVNEGLRKSNIVLDEANAKVPEEVDKLARKDEANLRKYADRAAPTRALSKEFTDYVQGIIDTMVNETGGYITEKRTGVTHLKDEKNKDITTRFLVGKEPAANLGKGAELERKILETKNKFLQFIDEADRDGFRNKISMNVDSAWTATKKKNWAHFNFYQMPLGATLPIFNKIENDAKSTEAAVLNYLMSKVGGEDIKFDKYQVVSAPKKSYIINGEKYEADLYLSASSSNVGSKMSATVAGASIPVIDGVAKYTATPSGIGVKKYSARFSVVNPVTNQVTTVEKEFEYEVGERSVTVSAAKMNVLYKGVDNPIEVSAAGISSNQISVSFDGPGTIKKNSDGTYTLHLENSAKPGTQGTITVSANGSSPTRKIFRIKAIPDPTPRLGGIKENVVGNGEFKAQVGIGAFLDNFDFDARCDIAGFKVTRVARGEDILEVTNPGTRFSSESMSVISKAKPGNLYLFSGIRCKCPGDEINRKLGDITVTIQ
ncbi:MAG: gliding motility protein GldM [Saprospiraceae bacterium]